MKSKYSQRRLRRNGKERRAVDSEWVKKGKWGHNLVQWVPTLKFTTVGMGAFDWSRFYGWVGWLGWVGGRTGEVSVDSSVELAVMEGETWGGVEGKHSPERGFELLFFDIKGGKVDLLSWWGKKKRVERQSLTGQERAWRIVINCVREFLERERMGCGEKRSSWPWPECHEGDREPECRCRGPGVCNFHSLCLYFLREIRSQCITKSEERVGGAS